MRFDLVDLRLFLRVAETASITHGAAKANMALASASERLRGMEEELGTALLERGRRGITLTPAGRALVHHAQLVLQQIENMRSELSEFAGSAKGHVRLLANTSALSEFLPEALNAFLADNPHGSHNNRRRAVTEAGCQRIQERRAAVVCALRHWFQALISPIVACAAELSGKTFAIADIGRPR